MKKKPFPTLAVATIVTGVGMGDGLGDAMYRVFDHLYPGIGGLGMVEMREAATAALRLQVPALHLLPDPYDDVITPENVDAWAVKCLRAFGKTIDVEGPL